MISRWAVKTTGRMNYIKACAAKMSSGMENPANDFFSTYKSCYLGNTNIPVGYYLRHIDINLSENISKLFYS